MPGVGLATFGQTAWVNQPPAFGKAKQFCLAFLLAPTEWAI